MAQQTQRSRRHRPNLRCQPDFPLLIIFLRLPILRVRPASSAISRPGLKLQAQ